MHEDVRYDGTYVDTVYGSESGILKNFKRINSLPPARSDNRARARYVDEQGRIFLGKKSAHRRPSVLDVGSGLCVFLHRMKRAGWKCTALDPDPRAVAHARKNVGVFAVCADFLKAGNLGTYDLITFNKVLEHVKDPVRMLSRAKSFLKPGGLVYIELPDGEVAVSEGREREEFTIDHWHVFSAISMGILIKKAGFHLLSLSRLREPSTKYTLRAFCCLNAPILAKV